MLVKLSNVALVEWDLWRKEIIRWSEPELRDESVGLGP
jgi:hypothetical protein